MYQIVIEIVPEKVPASDQKYQKYLLPRVLKLSLMTEKSYVLKMYLQKSVYHAWCVHDCVFVQLLYMYADPLWSWTKIHVQSHSYSKTKVLSYYVQMCVRICCRDEEWRNAFEFFAELQLFDVERHRLLTYLCHLFRLQRCDVLFALDVQFLNVVPFLRQVLQRNVIKK